MLKKRIIFTLLYDAGHFMLSRNFRLQKVGNLQWLKRNYNFDHIAFFIDELIVLDVSRSPRNHHQFCSTLRSLTERCFVPIAAGGGVRTLEHARQLLRSGADKVVINTPLFTDADFVGQLAMEFGQQCVVGSVDLNRSSSASSYQILINSGSGKLDAPLATWLTKIVQMPIGELYLNSVERDGTGQGYDLAMLDELPVDLEIPLILAGGVGNASHFAAGLDDHRVDAVATAHLFNFVGDGLEKARDQLLKQGRDLACWPTVGAMKTGMSV